MSRAWIVKAFVDGDRKPIYLFQYVGATLVEARAKVRHQAMKEGFTGTANQRLKELGWTIVEVELTEV